MSFINNKVVKILGVFVFLGIFSVIGFIGMIGYFSYDLPKISSLADYRPLLSSQILSKDGVVLADIGYEKREVVSMEKIPERVINAFLSAEDDSFYAHSGVDYWGIARALIVNLRAGKVVQGGSTITQQVAKSLLLTNERSLTRKIKDFLLAQKIEKQFSKKEILYLYLNQVYLGGGFYGIKAAFDGYYGKDLSEATIAESAMIAGLLVAPGKYSPYINPAFAKRRQEYVLRRMFDTKKITKTEYESALNEVIKFRIRHKQFFKAGYFTDWIRQKLIEQVGEEKLLSEGYKITTTLDYESQVIAEREVLKGVREVDKRQGYKNANIKLEGWPNSLNDWEWKTRKNILENESQYFTISSDKLKRYEIEFDKTLFDQIQAEKNKIEQEFKSISLIAGNSDQDSFINYLQLGSTYKAVVLKVDDTNKLIFATIGGARVVIPESYFSWARPREINETSQFFPPLSRPSLLFSPGNIIEIEIIKQTSTIADLVTTNKAKQKLLSSQDQQKKQKFVIGKLDQVPEIQGALVSLNSKNGEIISFVGGNDFSISQFNRAIQSKRQPGSSFKPILFAAALENGYTPSTIILDSPEVLGGVSEDSNWKPKNYDGEFKGPITLRKALEESRNIPTIKIASDLGVQKIKNFCKRIGLSAELEEDLSLALGSFGVTLLDIVKTYSIFPNAGTVVTPKAILSIVDREGKAISIPSELAVYGKVDIKVEQTTPTPEASGNNAVQNTNIFLESLKGSQVYDPRLAYIMSNLLRGVVQNGTGASARDLGYNIGGKTGTTSNYIDAWFIGISPSVTAGVWIGFDDNKTMGHGETGTRSALPIWKEYMREMLKKYGDYEFLQPPGIVNVLIDKATGKPTTEGGKESMIESFVEGMISEGGQLGPKATGSSDNSGKLILEEDDYYSNQ